MGLALNMADKVLLWIHGRRLGLTSDGQGDAVLGTLLSSTALVMDGVVVASTRAPVVKAVLCLSVAGAITLAGALVGDNVVSVTDLSSGTDVSANFESAISVAGQIQQTASQTAHQVLVVLQPQS